MGPAGTGARWRGSGRGRGLDPRIVVGAVVGAVVVVALLRGGRINRFEIIYFCVLVPSIILHEVSHGAVALAFGDDTARRMGRLTLNPVRHVDLVGTIIVPAVLSLSGLGAYGWAKPVPVSTQRLRSPRNHTVVVSLAGPVTNFALAALLGAVFVAVEPASTRTAVSFGYFPPDLLGQVLFLGGVANLILGLFNLVPCPPLDGASVLERFIPARHLPGYYRIQPALLFLPFVLLLLFRNEWSAAVGHLLSWWAGLLG